MLIESRLQLLAALRTAREALAAASSPLDKLVQLQAIREQRLKLGANTDAPEPTGAQETGSATGVYPMPTATPVDPVNEHHRELISISKGELDGCGLAELYGLIQSAVLSLQDAQMLEGPVIDAANAAITHWGELDHQLNG